MKVFVRTPLIDLSAARRNRLRVTALQQAEAYMSGPARDNERRRLASGWDRSKSRARKQQRKATR